MTIKTNAKDARQKLSYLLDQVENGEEIIILRRGNIIARIISPNYDKKKMGLPSLKSFRNSVKVKGKPLSQMVIEDRKEK